MPDLLATAEWQRRRREHERRVDALTEQHLRRRSRQEKHPVWDFMFDYYPFSPGKMRRWHPGMDCALIGDAPHAQWSFYRSTGAGDEARTSVNLSALAPKRVRLWRFLAELLQREETNPARFDCFGMHEWAMVYRTDEARHELPLRLGAAGTDAVVEAHGPLKCTHYDAFRFYTPPARPLNIRPLQREDQLSCEQRGCLHATMDLYKWSFKMLPVVPSELVIDAFELACEARTLDMEASPYDCRGLGFGSVAVETAAGKAEYVARQRALSRAAEPIRHRLRYYVERALATTLNE
ncbi:MULTISPECIES: 3-methyladenine DNA glycosylase [Corynebacterium]|uniref:3-methyladenine DNA glycosylase n=1 Tax=Corynebacterium TaxID=1716 RepID=UPI00124DF83B|nr:MULTISPECIES: 3-methyladenine DNA glycosylase [Corynebacterium]